MYDADILRSCLLRSALNSKLLYKKNRLHFPNLNVKNTFLQTKKVAREVIGCSY